MGDLVGTAMIGKTGESSNHGNNACSLGLISQYIVRRDMINNCLSDCHGRIAGWNAMYFRCGGKGGNVESHFSISAID